MARLAPGFFGLALAILWIWAVLDVIATDRILIRNLDKMVWLLLVIFVPTVGAVAWIALGRPANAGFTPGATTIRPDHVDRKAAPRGLEDSDAWRANTKPSTPIDTSGESHAAKERRLLEWEAELAKREENLEDPDG
ncbi:MAG: PLD nuclease N-terminal domain-containing protein [Acidimicrobiia bacterium]|nr:PLD nuclease N-terminal domain-containing protein [Acidimicrobiia bacterium]